MVLPIPAVEAVHTEDVQPRTHVGDDDEAVIVTDVHAERALHHARGALPPVLLRATEPLPVLALARVIVAYRHRVVRILHVEHLQPVLVRRDEHVRPTHLVVVGERTPVRRPCADGNVDVLRLARLARLEVPDPKWRVLILRLGHRITTIRRRRERVREVEAETRDGEELLGRFRLGDVEDRIAAKAGAVELVLFGRGVVPNVEVVITAEAGLPHGRRVRDLADDPCARVSPADDLTEIVDDRLRFIRGREVECAAIRVLVGERVVEAARRLRVVDARNDLDLRRIRQPGDVEDHGAEVRVGRALIELERLREVVAAVHLEVLPIHGADAAMQLGVLDGPAVDLLRRGRVADVVDRDVVIDEAREVRVRAVPVLLELDVGGLPRPLMRGHVRQALHLVAAATLLVEVDNGLPGVLGDGVGRESAQGGECGDDDESAHPVSPAVVEGFVRSSPAS